MILKPHLVIHFKPTDTKASDGVRILGKVYQQSGTFRCHIYPLTQEDVLTLSKITFNLPHMCLHDLDPTSIAVGDLLRLDTRVFMVKSRPQQFDIKNVARNNQVLLEEIISAPDSAS